MKSNSMKKWFACLISLFLVAGAVVGCSSGSQSSSSPQNTGSQEKIKIGLSPWPGWFVWYLVKEKGFFEKHGVNADLVWFPVYSDSLTALNTGKIDANSQTLIDTLTPVSKGIPLKAVLVNDNSNGGDGVVVKPDITSLQQLKGKKIATELGTVDHFLMLTGLDKAGLKESDVQYTNMTVNDAGPAFISGNLDAAVLWEPFLSKAVQEGKGKLLFSSADTPGLIPDLLVFREEVAKNKPEEVQKVIAAWFDALEYWKEHPDESMAIMAKAAETPVDEYKKSVEGVKIFSLEDNRNAFKEADNMTSLLFTGKKTGEFLKRVGFIDNIPDVSKIIDGQFIQKASANK
ncbi:ABC transporter substrate-binding protein [Effusibacillus dendaii]|nr:ABC transporter substrate-binding protein [Effusibacillus dendaii]